MPFKGHSAFDPQAQIDLAIDEDQDALEIDAAGDVLEVSPHVVWIGHRAADPQETLLAIDAKGDLLAIDGAGDVLAVSHTTFKGHRAFDPQGEIDLAIDVNQDALAIDAAGDLLQVSPEVVWSGETASQEL
jgi:hypothetical protein